MILNKHSIPLRIREVQSHQFSHLPLHLSDHKRTETHTHTQRQTRAPSPLLLAQDVEEQTHFRGGPTRSWGGGGASSEWGGELGWVWSSLKGTKQYITELYLGRSYLRLKCGWVFVAYGGKSPWSFLLWVAPPVRKLDLVFAAYCSPTVSKRMNCKSKDLKL